MAQSISVLEVRISIEKIRAMSPEQRYSYYLLGFICNELTALRKLTSFALMQARGGDTRPVRANADMSQVLMLFRIACAKAWEAHRKLNSREISHVLHTDLYPKWKEGPDLLRRLNKAVADADWLPHIRNTLAFHYPSMNEWKLQTTPDDRWVDDVLYLGTETGNTFYDAAETVVKHHMFSERAESVEQTAQMVDTMIDLLGLMTDFVENAVGTLITAKLIDTLPAGPRHQLSAPSFFEMRLPFWTVMPNKKGDV